MVICMMNFENKSNSGKYEFICKYAWLCFETRWPWSSRGIVLCLWKFDKDGSWLIDLIFGTWV